jgi:plasmid stabilization system protein ParE
MALRSSSYENRTKNKRGHITLSSLFAREGFGDGRDRYVARPDLGDAIRICAHGNYLIVFEPFDDTAFVLRVLRGARNVPEICGSP